MFESILSGLREHLIEVVVVCVVLTLSYLVYRNIRKSRSQGRVYRERERQRREFWGWG